MSQVAQEDLEVLRDLLSLVMDEPPSLEAMQSWNHTMCDEAELWAAKSHIRASDNYVRVPAKPKFLMYERNGTE